MPMHVLVDLLASGRVFVFFFIFIWVQVSGRQKNKNTIRMSLIPLLYKIKAVVLCMTFDRKYNNRSYSRSPPPPILCIVRRHQKNLVITTCLVIPSYLFLEWYCIGEAHLISCQNNYTFMFGHSFRPALTPCALKIGVYEVQSMAQKML